MARRDDAARQAAAIAHQDVELVAPVVEVAGDDQAFALRHLGLDEACEPVDLAHAAGVDQPEVRDDRMHQHAVPLHRHVQQAALLEAMVGHIVVARVEIGRAHV